MIPKSLSASSLAVAELCLARWKAEYFMKAPSHGKEAADLGTACHGALENFIKATKPEMGGDPQWYNLETLLMMFRVAYMEAFGTSDASGEMFEDGVAMLTKWFGRQNWDGVTVLSAELKTNFPVPTSAGPIPFNYIWDRFDDIGNGEYKVVDYKTLRWNLRPEDLKKKIQARCYGLAAAIQLKAQGKEYKRVWVEFDMLRHDPIGISYSREELAATWDFIRAKAEAIIAAPEDDTPERLNPECRFCIRKLECVALQTNIAAGGSFAVSASQAVDLRATMEYQAKALTSAIEALDEIILTESRETDTLEWETDTNRLRVGLSQGKRQADPDRAKRILGPELWEKYGGNKLAVAVVDRLLRGDELTPEQKGQLRTIVSKPLGQPKVFVEAKNGLDDD